MGLPPGATSARGTMSVRPIKQGAALCQWLVSLRGTYTIRKDFSRRMAWAAFISLLRFRMQQSQFGFIPGLDAQNPANQQPPRPNVPPLPDLPPNWNAQQQDAVDQVAKQLQQAGVDRSKMKAILWSFGFDEGLYLDSKTITFEASWLLFTVLDNILFATGVWQDNSGAAGPVGPDGKPATLWSLSMRDVQGWKSWLVNAFNPQQDAVIDLGAP